MSARVRVIMETAVQEVLTDLDLKITLKTEQMDILRLLVCNRSHVLGLLPTGYGKSMCYGLLPLIFDKVCLYPHPEAHIERDIII